MITTTAGAVKRVLIEAFTYYRSAAGWIGPDGKMYGLGGRIHMHFAKDWISANPKLDRLREEPHNMHEMEIMFKHGWVRVVLKSMYEGPHPSQLSRAAKTAIAQHARGVRDNIVYDVYNRPDTRGGYMEAPYESFVDWLRG